MFVALENLTLIYPLRELKLKLEWSPLFVTWFLRNNFVEKFYDFRTYFIIVGCVRLFCTSRDLLHWILWRLYIDLVFSVWIYLSQSPWAVTPVRPDSTTVKYTVTNRGGRVPEPTLPGRRVGQGEWDGGGGKAPQPTSAWPPPPRWTERRTNIVKT